MDEQNINFRVSDVVQVGGLTFRSQQELDRFIKDAQEAGELAFTGKDINLVDKLSSVSIITDRNSTRILLDGKELKNVVEFDYHHKGGELPELTVRYAVTQADIQTLDGILLKNRNTEGAALRPERSAS